MWGYITWTGHLCHAGDYLPVIASSTTTQRVFHAWCQRHPDTMWFMLTCSDTCVWLGFYCGCGSICVGCYSFSTILLLIFLAKLYRASLAGCWVNDWLWYMARSKLSCARTQHAQRPELAWFRGKRIKPWMLWSQCLFWATAKFENSLSQRCHKLSLASAINL